MSQYRISALRTLFGACINLYSQVSRINSMELARVETRVRADVGTVLFLVLFAHSLREQGVRFGYSNLL